MIDVSTLPLEPCLFEPRKDRALERYARQRLGIGHPAVRYLVGVPWVARAAIDLHPELGLLMELDQRTADLVGLVVSQENACRFCYAAVRAGLWLQGMDRERIERVERDFSRADLAPRARAAIGYARVQSRSGPAGAVRAWAAMREAGVSAAQAREVAFTVALTDFHNRLFTMPAIPSLPFERMPEQWSMRLLRPLLDRMMRRRRHRGHATALPAGSDGLPYARLVAAFDGSPIAATLTGVLNGMLESPHLSRRCKLLIFAVVSRGLPCELCEVEVGQALRQEGLDAATIDAALAHLDAPALDPVERLLLPFARETLWYQPPTLQRRTRALREHLSEEQLLEAIAVASLANGLCRMAAAVLSEPAR